MKKQEILNFIFSFLALFIFSNTEAAPMNGSWFDNTSCNFLEIKKLKSISDHYVIRSIEIKDAHAIKSLIDRIENIPADGDMMKSFGPDAEEISLLFHCGNKIQEIGIYNKRFKTPSTGFNVGESKTEESLYNDIDALLFPDFNKFFLKVEDLELVFKGFSVTYKGSEFKDFAPATIQTLTQKFLITDSVKHTQLIEVHSGQVPPQVKLIEVNRGGMRLFNSKIKLLTYQTDKGIRLYPSYFQIVN
jgi:hypothetical protein